MGLVNWTELESLDDFEDVWDEFREGCREGLSKQLEVDIRDWHGKFAVLKSFYLVKAAQFGKIAGLKKPLLKVIEAKEINSAIGKSVNQKEALARASDNYKNAVEEAGEAEGNQLFWQAHANSAESAMIVLSREISIRLGK